MEGNERLLQVYEKKQTKSIVFGLVVAFIAAMFLCVFQNFNVAASAMFEESFASGLLSVYFMCVMVLGVCEIGAAIMTVIFNRMRGIPFAEIKRTWNVNSAKTIMISSIIAGPIGTASSLVAITLIGSTYANCIVGLHPVVTCFLGVILLKEKVNPRILAGIAIAVGGALIANFIGAPEGATNILLGVLIAAIGPIAFALEGVISTHAVDVTDPMIACPIFRLFMSGVFEVVICIGLVVITGHVEWIGLLFGLITSSPLCMLFLVCCMIGMVVQYNGTYSSYNYCGAVKAQAILCTGTFWTIPVGFIMGGLGIIDYAVTITGVIGAICVVIGILMVVAKPSELFNLRSN